MPLAVPKNLHVTVTILIILMLIHLRALRITGAQKVAEIFLNVLRKRVEMQPAARALVPRTIGVGGRGPGLRGSGVIKLLPQDFNICNF